MHTILNGYKICIDTNSDAQKGTHRLLKQSLRSFRRSAGEPTARLGACEPQRRIAYTNTEASWVKFVTQATESETLAIEGREAGTHCGFDLRFGV